RQWPYSRAVMLPHAKAAGDTGPAAAAGSEAGGPTPAHDRAAGRVTGGQREGPEAGEMFRQPDLAATLRKLVEAEQQALRQGRSRKEAIYAAYDRFYKGDIAQELVRSVRE